jgi:hypothetical protein
MMTHTEPSIKKAGPAGVKLGVLLTSAKHPDLEGVKCEKPHEALANLHADAEAMQQFTGRWGILLAPGKDATLGLAPIGQLGVFGYRHPALDLQPLLQAAWRGDKPALQEIRDSVSKYMKTTWDFRDGQLLVSADDLWSTICIQFLFDHSANKTAICENPDCTEPFFVRKRRTGRYCGSAICAQYAQRASARQQWAAVGKKRREQKQREEKRKKAQMRKKVST